MHTVFLGLFRGGQRGSYERCRRWFWGIWLVPLKWVQRAFPGHDCRTEVVRTSSRTTRRPFPTNQPHAHNRYPLKPSKYTRKKKAKTQYVHSRATRFLSRQTSGARYSGVPQNVVVETPYFISSLHKPKSAILMWPSLSSNKFSN